VLVTVGAPRPAAIDRVLADASAASPTYDQVGASLTGDLPAGYRHDRWSAALGQGASAFDAAVAGLRRWEGHRHAGIAVHPADTPPAAGADVALVVPVGLLTLTVANRIVAVVDEDRRFAVVYGTLPGHGEQGEDAFVINRHDGGAVTLDIVAFSRPVGLSRFGAPAVRLLQQRATSRYLSGLQRLAKADAP